MSKISKDNAQVKQYTKLLNDSKRFIESMDFCSKENVISDKMIYAKKALYIRDFDPNYAFFCKGRSLIDGDLEINGKLIYNDKEKKNVENTISVCLNDNKNIPSGFSIKNSGENKEKYGLYYLSNENNFILGEEKDNKISNNQTLKVNSVNCFNSFAKNIIVGSTILTSNNNGKIILDCDKLQLNGQIISENLIINSNNTVMNSEVKINENLYVNKNISCKNLSNENIVSAKIRCDDVNVNEIKCLKNIDTLNLSVNYDLIVKNNTIIDGILYVNNELKFNEKVPVPFQFQNITPIPNLSCEYINKKKVSNEGDIVVSNANQILTNKSFDDSLDMNYNQIKQLSEPIDMNDAVNKNYVDKYVFGLNFIEQVRVSTVNQLNGSFISNTRQIISNKPEQLIIDNILLNINDRVLIKNQENKLENGIYRVVASGNRRQQWIIQLEEDYKEIILRNDRSNNILWVEEGTDNKNSLYIFNNQYNFIRFSNKELLNDYINISSSEILKSISFLKKKIEKIERDGGRY